MSALMLLLVIGFSVVIVTGFIVLLIFSIKWEKERAEALTREFAALGLTLHPGRNTHIPKTLPFLNKLREGSDRFAQNVGQGTLDGHTLLVFDYHFETTSGSGDDKKTSSHWYHLFVLTLPASFPELTIGPNNIFSRLAQSLGMASINFESAEFSRTFLVRSKDKRFAYDVCHPRTMEYLLANRDLTIEIEQNVLALIFTNRIDPAKLSRDYQRLREIRQLLPDYLFEQSTAP